ncbi:MULTISPECIES: 2-succinyl-6-hydroxy-2,4-cyclohexadiene-1-carboxylate synthase [unclassified Anabaena]|uniref:2-succinyl-6-hydroxy-2, 4-cyclohexadiene-1-carboxylate synthase n=1 Tax=unclassified Anabaena TaxID=2619674 RepID=UPI000831968C|nr:MULTISPECIES: 2-succinyl-6-hydroxy-2,4-cyclohexadiene-1-carboxylate synthase [unclassified Anabaena]
MIGENYQFNYNLIIHPNKPIIVFLHGFMGNLHEFDAAIKLLADEFSYLIIDLPGHGKTQVLGGDEYYTMANTATAIINLLDKLKITKCFLVGYSMGGRLALYLTLNFPERFDQVILESASPGLATETERLARVKSDAQIARKLARSEAKADFAAFLLNWYNQPIFGAMKTHPDFNSLLENRLQNHPVELTKSLQFMGTGSQPSLWEKLKNNQIPLLLLVGENDDKFIEINKKTASVCQLAELKIIRNSAHNIHFENTLEFVHHLTGCLRDNLSR